MPSTKNGLTAEREITLFWDSGDFRDTKLTDDGKVH